MLLDISISADSEWPVPYCPRVGGSPLTPQGHLPSLLLLLCISEYCCNDLVSPELPLPHLQFIWMHSPQAHAQLLWYVVLSEELSPGLNVQWSALPHKGLALASFEHILKSTCGNGFNLPCGVGCHAMPSVYALPLTRLVSTELVATAIVTLMIHTHTYSCNGASF